LAGGTEHEEARIAMSYQPQCPCTRCRIRSLMGPAIITTLGVLFLLHEMAGGGLSIGNTYPFLFIIVGAVLLGSAVAPMDGHIEPVSPLQVPPMSPPPAVPPTYSNPYRGQGR